MLYKSGLVTQASGSIGGITASHNRGGSYFRSRVVPVDPATGRQLDVRAIMGALANAWVNILTDVQRTAWNVYGTNVTVTNPLGDAIHISGINHYVRSNTPRLQAGLARVDAAPVIFDLGQTPDITTLVLDTAADTLEITYPATAANPWRTAVGSALLVYQGKPRNASKAFFRGPWRFVGLVPGAVVPPASPQTLGPPLAFVATTAQLVTIRLVSTLIDGRLSQDLQMDTQLV